MKRGNKKGSHIGMMLSLAIFVTFVVFLFSILQPIIKTRQNKQLDLESLRTELVEMLGSDLTTYSGGSIRTTDGSFTTSLSQVATNYNSDYNGLKTDLKIPEDSEFAFDFINTEETIEVTAGENVPQSVNIYIMKVPVYYIGGDKNILLGFINLKVW